MNLFSYLKTRVAILDVISEYATLKKAGLYWKGQCPFHSEKTASFTVSPHKEIFYCFGCHVGGDVIAFIARKEQCTQLEAAKHLIERYHIELPSTLAGEVGSSSSTDEKHYYYMCQKVAEWCHEQLLKSAEAFSYLAKRDITKKSIEHFSIGYMPGGLSHIKRFCQDMAKHNILVDDLLQAHILSKGKNVLFSPFEERIMFPITDHLGRYCGFGGRVFKPNDTRPKYYNSHENEHFAKGHLLFGLDKAKKDIQKSGTVFLVEGYTDCVAMAQYGYGNTVATLGTACTVDHLIALSRYAQQLYVLYDGDNAGQQAILRIGQLCWQASIDMKVIRLPATEDPASFLSKHTELEPFIKSAIDIFAFFIETLGIDFAQQTLGQKLQVTRKILEMIQKIDEPLKQDILLQNASKHLEIPFDSLKRELIRLAGGPRANTIRANPGITQTQAPPFMESTGSVAPLENKIFFSILNNIQLINKANEEFLIGYLPHPLCDILKKLQDEKKRVPNLGFIQFFETLDQTDQQLVSKTILENQEEIQPGLFEQLLTQLQKKHWKLIVNNIKIKLEAAKHLGNDAEIAALMRDFADLKKKVIGKMLPE
jgi:DNA primase